jgi:hypothetical protein
MTEEQNSKSEREARNIASHIHSRKEEASYTAQECFKWYFATGVAALVLGPLIFGWEGILYSLVLIILLIMLFYFHDVMSKENSAFHRASTGMGFLLCLFIIQYQQNQRHQQNQQRETATRQQVDNRLPQRELRLLNALQKRDALLKRTAEATQKYWQTTIADLHPLRFYFIDDEEQSVRDFYENRNRRLREEIIEIRKHSFPHVDPQLKAMSERLSTHDLQVMSTFEELMGIAREDGLRDDEVTIGSQIEEHYQLLAELANNPAALEEIKDPKLREMVRTLLESDLTQADRYQEILLMQARLQERYKGYSFPLPEPPQ